MSQIRRKITLQLIPLLDLLLIVIFAQFMEMRQKTEQLAKRTDEAEQATAVAKQRVFEGSQELERQRIEFQQDQQRTEARHKASMSEIARLTNLVAELFHLPEPFVKKALELKADNDDRVKLRKLLDNLPRGESVDVVHQMATLSELRRLSDVWEFHLDAKDVLSIRYPLPANSTTQGSERIEFESQADFERKLFAWFKSLSGMKNVVVIQYTWDDASAGPKFSVREGIIRSLDRMRNARNGQTVFEFIVLGFHPRNS